MAISALFLGIEFSSPVVLQHGGFSQQFSYESNYSNPAVVGAVPASGMFSPTTK